LKRAPEQIGPELLRWRCAGGYDDIGGVGKQLQNVINMYDPTVRITSNSIDELGELSSDLTSALQNLQEYLKAEGERVQREIVDYAHLNRTALAAIKTIIETTRAPSNGQDGDD